MSTPEGLVLGAIMDYLKARQIYAWRNNSGAVKVGTPEASRYVRYGRKGSSDILGILDDGRFLAIEVKSAKGKATPEQVEFLADITKRGGVAFVARSIEDIDAHLFQPGYGHEFFGEKKPKGGKKCSTK